MPCVSILLFILIGIFLAHFNSIAVLQGSSLNLSACLILILFNAGYVKKKGAIFNVSIILLLVLLGFTRYNFHVTLPDPLAQAILAQKNQHIEGTIIKITPKKNSAQLMVALSKICDENKCVSIVDQKIILYHKSLEDCPIYIGDKLSGKTRLNTPTTSTNPDAFDYKSFLRYQGINLIGNYRCQNFKVVGHEQAHGLKRIAISTRDYCLRVLKKRLKEDAHFNLCSALVLGQKSNLTKEMKSSFSDSGAMHVLAVSGLHVGILVQILVFLFAQLKAEKKIWLLTQNLLIIFIIWIFVLITGASPSVLRSASMFSLFVMGRQFYQPANAFNIIAGSAIILILINPYILFQVSFQFSYIALTSIVYFYPMVSSWLTPNNVVLKYFWQISALSIAAQILIVPLSLYYFHKAPWYSVLSSLVAVPAAGLIISSNLLLFVVDSWLDLVATKLALLISKICGALIQCIEWIQQLPLAQDFFIAFGFKQLMLSYFVILCLVLVRLNRKRRWQLAVILMLSITALIKTFIHRNETGGWNKELVIYDSYKGIIMDVFLGHKCYQISPASISDDEINYIAGNHRIQKTIAEVIPLNPQSAFKADQIAGEKSYWQIKERLIVFLSEQSLLPSDKQLTPYLLILDKCSPAKLKEALKNLSPEKIIIAPGIKPWHIDEIKEILHDNKLNQFHNIRESGSISIKI